MHECDYSIPERVKSAIDSIDARRGDLGTVLALRWHLDVLMDKVRPTELSASELTAIIAILTQDGRDIDQRVSGIDNPSHAHRPHSLGVLIGLRRQLDALMDQVDPTKLSPSELIAIIAIMTPALGRQLATKAITESLPPLLRLVGGSIDPGTAPEFVENLPGREVIEPVV
jgi:hypothetical protein